MHRTKLKMASKLVMLAMPVALVASCGTMGSGGGQSYALMPGESTPAATGVVKVKENKNMNREVDLTVQHLPRPAELDPSLTTYVVWIDPGSGQDPMPVSQLQIGKDRQAKAKITTPFSSFDLMVTAEPNGTPQKPSNHIVLEGRIYSIPPAG